MVARLHGATTDTEFIRGPAQRIDLTRLYWKFVDRVLNGRNDHAIEIEGIDYGGILRDVPQRDYAVGQLDGFKGGIAHRSRRFPNDAAG